MKFFYKQLLGMDVSRFVYDLDCWGKSNKQESPHGVDESREELLSLSNNIEEETRRGDENDQLSPAPNGRERKKIRLYEIKEGDTCRSVLESLGVIKPKVPWNQVKRGWEQLMQYNRAWIDQRAKKNPAYEDVLIFGPIKNGCIGLMLKSPVSEDVEKGQEFKTVKVRKGDTLFSIFSREGVVFDPSNLERVRALNRLNFDYTIQIGQELRIPKEILYDKRQKTKDRKEIGSEKKYRGKLRPLSGPILETQIGRAGSERRRVSSISTIASNRMK